MPAEAMSAVTEKFSSPSTSTIATATIAQVVRLLSTVPIVRVRCTTRTACSGDALSSTVCSTFWAFLTPETTRSTTRRITTPSTQRSTAAPTITPTIRNAAS